MRERNGRSRAPKGERKHIRDAKAQIRSTDLPQTFLTSGDTAISEIRSKFFSDKIEPREEKLLRQWWQIRKEYTESPDNEAFYNATREFQQGLDKNGELSNTFYSALKFITDTFTKPAGK